MARGNGKDVVIAVRDLVVGFGDHIVLDHVDLDVYRGEILGFVGGSGAGKSVLMRTIVGLLPRREGKISVFGVDLATASDAERHALERRWGVLFQEGALFSSLTVRENIQFPIREYLQLSQTVLDELAMAKLEMVGLHSSVLEKFPSELSGGMTKRVALARALALDPEIVFLDEPTSGLDPIGAADFDKLIATLQRTLGLTVFMVTHDLDSLHTVCDRIAVLADGKVIAAGDDGDDARVHTSVAARLLPRQALARRSGCGGAELRREIRTHWWLQVARSVPRRARANGNQSKLRVDRNVHAGGDRRRIRLRLLVPERRRHRASGCPTASCSTARSRVCTPAPMSCSTASRSAR